MSHTDSNTLSQDAAFDLLSNARRRFVLRRLQSHRDGIELSDLAEELAAKENDLSPDELSAQQRKRTYVSLYQTHIPKLSEAGVVEYDSETGMVSPTRHVDELAQYFDEESEPISWQLIYVGIASAGLVVYLVSIAVEVPLLRPSYVGVAILVSLVIVSGVHYVYTERQMTNGAKIPVEDD
ncbi:hypothetical protein DVK02_11445 [Halobellus sp. Atlit-31R]|nr:hypothetical protein DVK02_11445 [Halobellus sp. Atlit-31R]